MKKFKVVITDYEYDTLEPERKVLEQLDVEIITVQCKTEEDLINIAKDADGIIHQYASFTKNVINRLEKCKVIARYGIGFDTVDIDAATEKGIYVANVTDYCLDEVADHTVAMLLTLARKIVTLNNSVKSGEWDYKVSKPICRLKNRVLGLVGFGNIPRNVAPKAQAFGLKIIVYDPIVPTDIAEDMGVDLVELSELCKQSDFISIHTPLNKHTKGMFSFEEFNLMKKDACIINTARGPIIDEKALIEALEQKKIAAAALDVLEKEPINRDHPLIKMDNVLLTPHTAFYSEESERDLKQKTAQNVVDVLQGHLPKYLVNPNVQQRISL
ncbi:C-terminal binding protein [Bacillus sp. JJ1533]|uniref:C-terminal binding protein n=1 Tax=Bacillus sp. JJ1533 TaxID=3122959 RepID=UPI0030006E76